MELTCANCGKPTELKKIEDLVSYREDYDYVSSCCEDNVIDDYGIVQWYRLERMYKEQKEYNFAANNW